MCSLHLYCYRFQSTLPRGERQIRLLLYLTIKKFQSTLPRGERLWNYITRFFLLYFNPRSHEGSDLKNLRLFTDITIFQSTLPRGERLVYGYSFVFRKRFQSTLPRGERQHQIFVNNNGFIFQSTLPRGERPLNVCGLRFSQDFNPRSHEGSDRCRSCNKVR